MTFSSRGSLTRIVLSENAFFLVACVTVASAGWPSGARASRKITGKWTGDLKIGASCERDRQCIEHAFCRMQLFCHCETYFSPSLDKATCHATIGTPCGTDEAADEQICETMSNAECRQNVCTCRDNFILDINNSSNCISKPKAPGDICHRNDECKESLGMSHCVDGGCACYTNYHFVNETGTCIKVRGLYEPCEKDYECFVDRRFPDEMQCKNGECACRNGESSAAGYCHAGTASHRSTPFVILATLILPATISNYFYSS